MASIQTVRRLFPQLKKLAMYMCGDDGQIGVLMEILDIDNNEINAIRAEAIKEGATENL